MITIPMISVAENVWVLRYPLNLMGTSIGRTSTVLRLSSKATIVHSTGPFEREDVAAIEALGHPVTLVEATLFHDTFARHGRTCFPKSNYLAPPGFGPEREVATEVLTIPLPAWEDDLDVLLLSGMPKVREHVFLHKPSRTLIVADLVFHFGPDASPWTRFFFRHLAGIKSYPGVSRLFRMMIHDRSAFRASLHRMMNWDFERVIVGHGEIMEQDGKERLRQALANYL